MDVSLAQGTKGWSVSHAGNGASVSLAGSANADTLTGGTGNGILIGNGGRDFLDGGAGDDYLTGGAGDDHFVYNALSSGHDRIEDFQQGHDVLDFSGSGLEFGDLVQSYSNGSTTVEYLGSTIILGNVGLLSQTDFLFG